MLNALDELGDRQTGLALDGERADAAAGETTLEFMPAEGPARTLVLKQGGAVIAFHRAD